MNAVLWPIIVHLLHMLSWIESCFSGTHITSSYFFLIIICYVLRLTTLRMPHVHSILTLLDHLRPSRFLVVFVVLSFLCYVSYVCLWSIFFCHCSIVFLVWILFFFTPFQNLFKIHVDMKGYCFPFCIWIILVLCTWKVTLFLLALTCLIIIIIIIIKKKYCCLLFSSWKSIKSFIQILWMQTYNTQIFNK